MKRLYSPIEACQWLKELSMDSDGTSAAPSTSSAGFVRKKRALQSDSRWVQEGDIFLAWPGASYDPRRDIDALLSKGILACLVDEESVDSIPKTTAFDQSSWVDDPRVAFYPQLKRHRGLIASAYYENPSQTLKVSAVTGTNGKTTCAWWLTQALSELGCSCAMAGTLGQGIFSAESQSIEGLGTQTAALTTMEALELQKSMRQWLDAGVSHLCMEASSIGLQESRIDGTQVEVAIFTNFTQDHLDYHTTMENYWAAKMGLFNRLNPKTCIINLDDPQGPPLYSELKSKGRVVMGYSKSAQCALPAELSARRIQVVELEDPSAGVVLSKTALSFEMVHQGQSYPFVLRVLGDFNVSNLLAVVCSLLALGYTMHQALRACSNLTAAPGRMQTLRLPETPLVVVDYAHTPDALEKALGSLQAASQSLGGQLWCIMGCGGDRDPSKRSLMGAAAERLADRVVLTSDNPRMEDPLQIIEHIKSGLMRPDVVSTQMDRGLAIEQAIKSARINDVILIAGKGHENYQDIHGERRVFSDAGVAWACLKARAGSVSHGEAHAH